VEAGGDGGIFSETLIYAAWPSVVGKPAFGINAHTYLTVVRLSADVLYTE